MNLRRTVMMPLVALAVCGGVLGACGGSAEEGDSVLAGVGRIPGSGSPVGAAVIDIGALDLPTLQGPVLGTRAIGNRLLVIGDSILAGTAARYGNEMCNELAPLGWRSTVEAESGQPASFGREVLRERIYEGWDAAVVFLGSNPSSNIDKYRVDMTRIVESLAPRPTLLLTTTLFRESQKAVNNVIREVVAAHDNVSLLDWGTASTQEGILNPDGIHPTAAGRTFLVRAVASAVGRAPTGTGGCIGAKFTDDGMGRDVLPSTTVASGDSVPASTMPPPATTVPVTVVPAAPTTVASGPTTTLLIPGSTSTTRP
jgi:hypothetical protein